MVKWKEKKFLPFCAAPFRRVSAAAAVALYRLSQIQIPKFPTSKWKSNFSFHFFSLVDPNEFFHTAFFSRLFASTWNSDTSYSCALLWWRHGASDNNKIVFDSFSSHFHWSSLEKSICSWETNMLTNKIVLESIFGWKINSIVLDAWSHKSASQRTIATANAQSECSTSTALSANN